MPKDRQSPPFDRCRASPYSRCDKNVDNRRPTSPSIPIGDENEWEEAKCAVCMEHPHNAVLLLCSSREKGCRPYMCDTSSRHSNCLDQFRKSNASPSLKASEGAQTKLVCPLCRGHINRWIVIKCARQFMNSKTRSCSLGTCDFVGNYSQLRKHAKDEHPDIRPREVDPKQELQWTRLEEEMEQLDMLLYEFDDDEDDDDDNVDDELMDGVHELDCPIWELDHEFHRFLLSFGSEFESILPELDLDSGDRTGISDNGEDISGFSSSGINEESRGAHFEHESRESGGSRGNNESYNRVLTRPRQRTVVQRHQSDQRRPTAHTREEQITTLVDFHDLRSNLP